jgi:hypothetical protein
MFILVYVRTKIKVTQSPVIDYELGKKPFYPGFEFDGTNWVKDFSVTSARQE